MSLVEVLDRQCDTCIFLPGNPMSLRPGRVAGMVRDCRRDGGFIPCHETMTYGDEDDEGNAPATGPICRGFYDAHGEVSQLVRIAWRLNAVTFVSYDERKNDGTL